VTTPCLDYGDVPQRRSDLHIDAWLLCAEFVQRIVFEALSGAAKDLPEDTLDVDWDSIWRAGDDALSDEAAIGKIVRAASDTARGISDRPLTALSQTSSTHSSDGATESPDPRRAGPPEADALVPSGPQKNQSESGAVSIGPSSPSPDLAMAPPEPAAPAEGPSMPVLRATAVVDQASVEGQAPPPERTQNSTDMRAGKSFSAARISGVPMV
jgi:hypothetical protein